MDNEDSIKYPTNTGQNPMDLDEPIILMEKVIIPAFASQIVKARSKKTFMQGHQLNVMVWRKVRWASQTLHNMSLSCCQDRMSPGSAR